MKLTKNITTYNQAPHSSERIEMLEKIISSLHKESLFLDTENSFKQESLIKYPLYRREFLKFLRKHKRYRDYLLGLISDIFFNDNMLLKLINKFNKYPKRHIWNKYNTWLNGDSYASPRVEVVNDIFENFNKYSSTLELLQEEQSRLVYADIIAGRLFKDYLFFYRNYDIHSTQYFERELIKISKGETIVQCGGFDGKTISDLITFDNNFGKVFVFEPLSENCNTIHKKFIGDDRIHIIGKGVSDVNDEINCSTTGDMMKVTDDGIDKMKIARIDDEINEPVGFIMMDVEGSELQALQGAQRVINNHRPKLAISIYHRFDDLWKIPAFIKKMNSDYKFYVRHYSTDQTDTILYAIP